MIFNKALLPIFIAALPLCLSSYQSNSSHLHHDMLLGSTLFTHTQVVLSLLIWHEYEYISMRS